MNKDRRKSIDALISQIEGVKSAIEGIRDEEQQSLDNLPEAMQDGGLGQKMPEAVDNLESAMDVLDEAVNSLEEAKA